MPLMTSSTNWDFFFFSCSRKKTWNWAVEIDEHKKTKLKEQNLDYTKIKAEISIHLLNTRGGCTIVSVTLLKIYYCNFVVWKLIQYISVTVALTNKGLLQPFHLFFQVNITTSGCILYCKLFHDVWPIVNYT